jgi:SAM-dependent methyltransferase
VLSEKGSDGTPLRVVLCEGCGLVRVEPLPDAGELAVFYRENCESLYQRPYRPSPRQVLRNAKVAAGRRRWIGEDLTPGMSLLDAGCGGGEFLYLVQAGGCRVAGAEPNLAHARYAQQELGLEVHGGLIGDQPFEADSFDRITMFHTLEHLPDPAAALRRVSAWLKPDGLLFVEVPDLQSGREHPEHRFHRAHLFYFTPETLALCGALAGLRAERAENSAQEGSVWAVFRRGGAQPDPRAAIFERLLLAERRRTAWRYWTTPETYGRAFRRFMDSRRERKEARRYRSPREVLDAVAALTGPENG